MRKFDNIARLVRSARLKKGLSQTELSHALGYKNGQYISNLERALCGLPPKKIVALSGLVAVDPDDIITEMELDYNATLDAEVKKAQQSSRLESKHCERFRDGVIL